MIKFRISLVVLSTVLMLGPISLLAQDIPPPSCCTTSPNGVAGEELKAPTQIQGRFLVPREMLRIQGMTQSQFIDRLTDSLFAGGRVMLVISSKESVSLDAPTIQLRSEMAAFNADGLFAVRQTSFYALPRYRFTSEQLDKLNEVSITNGEVSVEIIFRETL